MFKNEAVALRILEDFRMGLITRKEAAGLLVCSERGVTRRAKKIRLKGIAGIKDGNYQRPAVNRIDKAKQADMLLLAKETYFDFNMVHCLEKLKELHALSVSYATFHGWCRKAGIGKHRRRRASKARVCRERMSCEGLLLQMDGSHHRWNGSEEWCLIAMIDDATSEIPGGKFFEGETTLGCMKVLRAVIEAKGGAPDDLHRPGWLGGGRRETAWI